MKITEMEKTTGPGSSMVAGMAIWWPQQVAGRAGWTRTAAAPLMALVMLGRGLAVQQQQEEGAGVVVSRVLLLAGVLKEQRWLARRVAGAGGGAGGGGTSRGAAAAAAIADAGSALGSCKTWVGKPSLLLHKHQHLVALCCFPPIFLSLVADGAAFALCLNRYDWPPRDPAKSPHNPRRSYGKFAGHQGDVRPPDLTADRWKGSSDSEEDGRSTSRSQSHGTNLVSPTYHTTRLPLGSSQAALAPPPPPHRMLSAGLGAAQNLPAEAAAGHGVPGTSAPTAAQMTKRKLGEPVITDLSLDSPLHGSPGNTSDTPGQQLPKRPRAEQQ
jgi:hypothetical protein